MRDAAAVAEDGEDVGDLAHLLEEVADVDDAQALALSRRISANRCATSSRCRLLVGSSISTMRARDGDGAADFDDLLRCERQLADQSIRLQVRMREAREHVERERLGL